MKIKLVGEVLKLEYSLNNSLILIKYYYNSYIPLYIVFPLK